MPWFHCECLYLAIGHGVGLIFRYVVRIVDAVPLRECLYTRDWAQREFDIALCGKDCGCGGSTVNACISRLGTAWVEYYVVWQGLWMPCPYGNVCMVKKIWLIFPRVSYLWVLIMSGDRHLLPF